MLTVSDRPLSVLKRRIIEVFVFSRCFLDLSVGVGAFDIGLRSLSFSLSSRQQRLCEFRFA